MYQTVFFWMEPWEFTKLNENIHHLQFSQYGLTLKEDESIIHELSHSYFIFVTFFTQPQFDAWKFYTWKCVNARQKLPHDKTA